MSERQRTNHQLSERVERNGNLASLAAAVLQPGFVGTVPPAWICRWLGDGLGSVVLFSRNVVDPGQVAALTAALRAERPDVIVAIDEEAGDVTRIESGLGSSRPGNLALGAVDDPALTEEVARDLGAELAAAGITLNYAPDADVNSNPDNPVIGVRSFGAEPSLVARHTTAWVRGLQSGGVAACAKHFPGHGDTRVDSHHDLPRIDADRDRLHAVELAPFRAAVAAGVQAVMTGHLLVPALDPDLPATLSARILGGLLREEMGFDGVVVTDAVEMGAVADRYGFAGAAVRALAAGADAICVGGEHADEETPTGGSAVGLVAARRAVRVTTSDATTVSLPLHGPAHVVEFQPPHNIAIGSATPWGVAAPLAALVPGTTSVRHVEQSCGPRSIGR